MVEEKDMIERVARLEADVNNIQEGNRLFRDEIRQTVDRVSQQNDAIYEIATSVKLMTQDLQGLKSDQKALHKRIDKEMDITHQKYGQLKDSLKDVDGKDANKVLKIWESIRDKLIWLVVGGIATYFLYQAFPFLK